MDIEEKKHKKVPVIKKAFVDLDGKPFKYYEMIFMDIGEINHILILDN